jgi:hypothetical protein
MSTKLTDHFTLEEMQHSEAALRLGIDNHIPDDLMSNAMKVAVVLEIIRAECAKIKGCNVPIHVTSCYRSPEVNKAVGGSKTSAHRFAAAADCKAEGLTVLGLCQLAAKVIPNFDQIIYEFGPTGWMHIGLSTSGKPRKQLLTAVKENGKTVYKQGLVE